MGFALGWLFRFAFVGMLYLAFTGAYKVPLPDSVMGHKVPASFR